MHTVFHEASGIVSCAMLTLLGKLDLGYIKSSRMWTVTDQSIKSDGVKLHGASVLKWAVQNSDSKRPSENCLRNFPLFEMDGKS